MVEYAEFIHIIITVMFKGKSPLGKENLMNQWFVNEQSKQGLSPVKNQSTNFEHSFANARKTKHNYQEKNHLNSNPDLLRRLSDPLDLECNQTLQFCSGEFAGGGQSHPKIETNLYCQEELEPIMDQNSSALKSYLQRMQSMLELYMRRDIQNRNKIKELEAQRSQLNAWNNQLQRQRVFYRK